MTGGVGSVDTLRGGEDGDLMYGDEATFNVAYGDNDIMYGDGGNDTMYGGGNHNEGSVPGGDQMFGNSGDDVMFGEYGDDTLDGGSGDDTRSEEHTSELQSLMRTSYAVFCLKKKNIR